MSEQKTPKSPPGLRERAEARSVTPARPFDAVVPQADPARLIHELEVHQIELEMQTDELLRVQAKLEASLDRYRDLYDFAPVGYVTLDATGRVVDANLAAASLLGTERGRLLHLPLARFIAQQSLRSYDLHARSHRDSEATTACEVRIVRPDGSGCDVRIESSPAANWPGAWRAILIDITQRNDAERALAVHTREIEETHRALVAEMARRERVQQELDARENERHQAEVALRRERDFSHRLLEAVPAIVLALTVEGRIEHLNDYTERLCGYAIEEVVGQDWITTFVAQAQRAEASEAFARVVAGTRTQRSTGQMVTRSGELRDVEWHHTPLFSESGEVIGVVAIGQDITENKRIDEELRQSQKMEAIGTLASGVAHDFNNVLMAIIGTADIVSSRLGAGNPLSRQMQQLKTSAHSGAEVIERLMTFARKRPTASAALNLTSLVVSMETMLRRLLGEDLHLRVVSTASDATVLANRSEIEQVIMNLCVNARQAMPHGGALTLLTRDAEITDDDSARLHDLKPGAYVVLEVTDTGVGMDERTRARIFEPFFTTKTGGQGTGLGLSTVYSVVQQHAGHIEVQSEPGRGTQFTIYLPLSKAEPFEASLDINLDLDVGTSASHGTETVLVLEDEPLVRAAVCHYLARHGYQVLAAASDADVMRLLTEHAGPIDMMLTDVVLPHRSGPEIAAQVQAQRPGLPVLFMSAHPSELLVAEGRLGAGTPTLQKPFTEAAVIGRVRELLDRTYSSSRPAPVEPTPLRDVAPRRTRSARVLLVEDDTVTREAMCELLRDEGHEVTPVATGTAALSAIDSDKGAFDVLVADLGLPDIDGVQLVKRIRGAAPGMPAIVLSGRSGNDLDVLALRSGEGIVFLQKPINFTQLAATLVGLLPPAPTA